MISPDEIKKIGKFQKTHALKGELNLICEIDPQYFVEGNPLIVDYDGILVPYYAESVRPKGTTSYLIKLSGVDNEEEASQFVNKEVSMLKKDAADWIEEDLIDEEELAGYEVIDVESGVSVGKITAIDDSTANIIFIVETEDGEEVYLPANEDLIKDIDEENATIKMIIPEGLLDINSKE